MGIHGVGKSRADLTQMKAGLERKTIENDEKMKSVFDKIDTDHNGVLDENEVQNFKKSLDKNQDNIATKKEARKFIKENNLKSEKIKKKDVIKFLQSYGENIKDVQDTEVLENGQVMITYNNGSKKIINPDSSYDTVETNDDESTTTKSYDKNDILQKELTETETSTIETLYAEDGKTKLQTTENNLVENTSSVTTYNDAGERETTIKTSETATEIVEYKDDKPSTKEVRQGSTVSNFEYLDDGSERITKKVENKGNDTLEKTTQYTYNDDGSYIEDITQNGTQTHTVNTYNANSHRLAQTKTVGDEEYTAKYDGNGNTEGIVIQNKETIEDVAKKFGCTVEQLQQLNGKETFAVGDTIKVPGELEADDKEIKDRKTSEEAKAEEQKDIEAEAEARRQAEIAQQRKAQRALEDAKLKPLGLKDRKGAGEKVEIETGDGRKVTLTKVGNAVNGRTICKNKSGRYYVVSHDGKVLKDDYVESTTLFANGKKVEGHLKDQNGNTITRQYAEVEGAPVDEHGRKLVVDSKGNPYYMAQDGTIVKSDYVARSNRADAMKADIQTARTETINMLEEQLDSAQAAFDQQMKKDGWAADVADGISYLWNYDLVNGATGNTARAVRKDLAEYKNTLAELKEAAQKGDAEFEATFEKKFGIKYNKDAVADYLTNPTAENYTKAFGTKQSIGERIAKYNASQDTGAAVVKTGAEIAGGIALTAATVATGGAAGVIAGAVVAGAATAASSVIVETTDRMTSEQGLQDGELGEIAKGAAIDGLVAGVTLGASKGLQAGYKAYKAGNAAAKAASAAAKAESVAAKAESAAIKSETALAKAETVAEKAEAAAAKSETALAKAETVAEKAEETAAKSETALAKAETVAEKAEETAAKSETALAKAETVAEKAEETAEKAEATAAKAEAAAEKAETTAAQAENAGEKAGTAAQAATTELSKAEEYTIDTVVNAGVGAGVEYAETGEVTIQGVAMNMAIGSVGLVGEKVGKSWKGMRNKMRNKVGAETPNLNPKSGESAPKSNVNGTDTSNNSHGTDTNNHTTTNEHVNETNNQKQTRTDGAKASEETQGTKQNAKTEETQGAKENAKTEETQGAKENAKTEETTNQTRTESNEGTKTAENTSEKVNNNPKEDINVNSMSDAELNKAIKDLDPKLKEAQRATEMKEEFAEVLNGNFPKDPAAFKKTYREMVQKAHPDRGGSDEIFQCVENLNSAIKKGDSYKIEKALTELNNTLDSKSANLKTYKTKMETLNTAAEARKAKAEAAETQPKAEATNSQAKTEAAEAQPKAENTAKAEEKASTSSEKRTPTPQEKMEMGEIGNDINKAKTPQDIANAQARLDKMPECPQKSRLQSQLNEKASTINVEVNAEFLGTDFSESVSGTALPKGENVFLGENSKLNLAGVYELDLNSPEIQERIKNLKNGEKLTVGRQGDIQINDMTGRVSRQHLEIQNINGEIVVKDISTNGTTIARKVSNSNIDPQYRATSDEFIPDELVRNAGNNGKPINPNYIQSSKDLREHYKKAIADGSYADSYENYVKTITDAHKVAYGGFDGQHTWYGNVGQGSLDVNPGHIRGKGIMESNRLKEGQMVEKIAQEYGDSYSIQNGAQKVNLEGIPSEACPVNDYITHTYPDGQYMPAYFKQMQRTAQEAVQLIKNGAPQDEILSKLAEHYQYAANARPFGQINNSLFMNEVNTLLQNAGMKTMPHGILDHAAQRLQPTAFKQYFIDEYKKTALSA